jgi:hypothetical protein
MNNSANGKAMSGIDRGMCSDTPKISNTIWTSEVTMTVTSMSALASSKLPKLYRPRYSAKRLPTMSWAATATTHTSTSPGTWTSL